MSTVGRCYDLGSLFERLNRLYFDSKLEISVRWSAREAQKAKRKVLLGAYYSETKTIVLSKRLDNPRVPLYFVEHVLFHEMLHHVFPRDPHRMHTEQFKKFERMHPDYERARIWEKESIGILMESSQKSFSFLRKTS